MNIRILRCGYMCIRINKKVKADQKGDNYD